MAGSQEPSGRNFFEESKLPRYSTANKTQVSSNSHQKESDAEHTSVPDSWSNTNMLLSFPEVLSLEENTSRNVY